MPAIVQVEPVTTARALRGPFDYRLPEELRGTGVDVGSMLVVPFGRRKLLGVVVGLAERSDVDEDKLLAPLRALELGVPAELVELAEWVAAHYCSTLARALTLVLPPGATRRLGGRRAGRPSPAHLSIGARRLHPPELGADQAAALAPLLAALDQRRHERRLLHGVTGSGKTEVYLRAAAAALDRGRGVIVLVPEIALTPQIVARFIDRFGDTVAVVHSRLTPAQRYAEWRRLRSGEARVCVGPRSAVFAPVGELGLLVVDEEHEAAYKHEGDPRYDAREVALRRAERAGAVLLLGSATPRPETVARMRSSRLPQRVDGRPLPDVEILDMRERRSGLHPDSAEALAALRAERGKGIVLLNRRGWSNFLSCRTCGKVWGCPDCDVALVLHRSQARLCCHHCGHAEPQPPRCDACGSVSVARHGAGTERLAHELAGVLDDGSFPVFRLDADTAGEGVAEILHRFGEAACGVLVGTQMVAKGHDFPDVGLGLVLDADATLRFPDFRAEERTFALIAQLAGRVGRGGHGRVLVQTIAPQARAILAAAEHDSDGFLAGELQRRIALGYPPAAHLVRIVVGAEQAGPARDAALAVRERLRDPALALDAGILGPASLFRLRARERQVLVVKAVDPEPAVGAVGDAVAAVAAQRGRGGVSFSVDVEPQ